MQGSKAALHSILVHAYVFRLFVCYSGSVVELLLITGRHEGNHLVVYCIKIFNGMQFKRRYSIF